MAQEFRASPFCASGLSRVQGLGEGLGFGFRV